VTLRQAQGEIAVQTRGRGLVEVTAEVAAWVAEQGVSSGLLTVFIRHTSASLTVQENADPSVQADLQAFFERLAPEDRALYRHSAEGPDDMPAHLRTAITKTSESVPIVGGALALGTWQALYLVEHRTRPHRRSVVVHVTGDVGSGA